MFGKTYDYQESYLATAAKRQKVEVKLKDLSPKESELFKQAKEKELKAPVGAIPVSDAM